MPADPAAVKALFLEAAAIDDPVARAALVNERCREDAALLARVNALLVANDRAAANEGTASFGSADGSDAAEPTTDRPGRDEHVGAVLAGKYKLIEAIGEGGMGNVYMAQQTEPVKRAVAVKVIKAGMDSKAVLARFDAERQALAMMDHPNIARVLDAGTTDSGRPYFVMELVKGMPITKFCDERKMTPKQRLELFVPVCQAIQHAHQKGIIHRDLKPSNVIVAMYDDRPVPKVIDFGVAKAAGQSLTDQTLMTGFGAVVGTPEYMSPEQANLNNLDIDTRSDVYSLGVLLYELLTGSTPVDRKRLDQAAILEILRIVREVEAPKPSHRLSTSDGLPSVAANRGTEPAKLSKLMKGELDWLVLKALEKDRTRRYETANALSRDIQRYLADEVVEARPPSARYRLKKFVRRHKGQVIAATLVLLALVGGIVGTSLGLYRENQARRAEAERVQERDAALDQARENAESAKKAENDAKTREGEAVAARDEAKQGRIAMASKARQAAGVLLGLGIEDARGGEPARALHRFVQALRTLPADDPEAAPLERVIRTNLSAWAETVPALEHIWPGGARFEDVAFTPAGEVIALAVGKDEVQCFRTDTGRPVGPSVKVPVGNGTAMVFAPDARSLWVASPGRGRFAEPGAIHRFDPASGRAVQPPIPTTGPVVRLAVTPDGRNLVGAVSGLHPEDWRGEADAGRIRKWRTSSIVVWTTATGRVVRKVDVNAESDYATANGWPDAYLGLSPDGKSVTAWVQRAANRFEEWSFTVEGNEPPIRRELPAVGPGALHFENNMRNGLAIKDDQLHRWSAAEPGVLGPGVPTPFRSMLYGPSADGRSVISQVEGRVFDTGAWPPRPTGVRFTHPGWQRSGPAWRSGGITEQSPDGRFTVTGIGTWIWNGESDRRLWRLPRAHSRPSLPPAEFARQPERTDYSYFTPFDPSGTRVLLFSQKRTDGTNHVHLVDVATGAVRESSVRHAALVREVAFSPDGHHFATASFDGTARVWESATGRPAGPPLTHTNYVATVAFSPDGNTLAAGDYGPAGLIKLWDWRTGKETRPPLRHDDIVLNVSFSPDGRYLAAIKSSDWSRNPELLAWDLASGNAVMRVRHHGPYYGIREPARFRPDGRAVTTRDVNGVLRLWEVASGKLLGERPLDGDGITRFSPDGRVVAAATLGVRLLDGNTLAPLPGGLLPHADPITDVAFSPDGAFLLVGYESGSAQLWDVATRKPVGPPAVLIGAIRAVTFTPDGRTCVCVAADGTVRRWPVPAPYALPDLVRLADRVALMTGQRMDDNQGLDSLPADEWRALRLGLVGDGSTALVPPRPDADWHDARAADAEQDHDAYGAEWHLDRLAALRPDDWTIPARRGRVLAAAGRKDEADAAHAIARRLAPSPQVLSDWLRVSAATEEAAGRKEQARWNLDRAVALTPGDWTLYALRAKLVDLARVVADEDEAIRLGAEPSMIQRAADRASASGDWKRSAALFNSLARNLAVSTQARYLQAVANLKAGDAVGYRAACAGIAKQLPPVDPKLSPAEAHNAALAFALGPNATDDWTRPLAWIDHALARLEAAEKANPNQKEGLRRMRHTFLNTRGAVLYRAGQFQESVKVLREGMSLHPNGGEFHDWLFLALAEHRSGHADAAKEAAAKTGTAQASHRFGTVWDRAEVELLTAELNAALPRETAPPPREEK